MTASLPAILALDPGGTTGYCYWEPMLGTNQENRWEQREFDNPDHHKELYDYLDWHLLRLPTGLELHIVCESFEFRQSERHRDYINYIPREYIGVVKLFVQNYPRVKLYMQKAGNVIGDKAFFNDDKVKRLGLWVPGLPHAMDATRHYLYHRVFTLGDKSILQLLR